MGRNQPAVGSRADGQKAALRVIKNRKVGVFQNGFNTPCDGFQARLLSRILTHAFFKRDERAQVIAAVNRRDKRLRQHMQILGGIPVIQVSVPGLKRLNCVKYMI